MNKEFKYNRVLIKLSGEALTKGANFGYDSQSIKNIVSSLIDMVQKNIEVSLVVGAGNIWRGEIGKKLGMDSVRADYMGMLGTVMNALCLKDSFESAGINCIVQSSLEMNPLVENFDHEKAIKSLKEGKIVIFAGGTGHPYFTTDTTAALRGLEIGAEALLKATKVNGIYSKDPIKYPDAEKYQKISYSEALSLNLKVMDSTAFSLCKDNNLPIIVFNFSGEGNLSKVLQGHTDIATIVLNK